MENEQIKKRNKSKKPRVPMLNVDESDSDFDDPHEHLSLMGEDSDPESFTSEEGEKEIVVGSFILVKVQLKRRQNKGRFH